MNKENQTDFKEWFDNHPLGLAKDYSWISHEGMAKVAWEAAIQSIYKNGKRVCHVRCDMSCHDKLVPLDAGYKANATLILD